jgi:hypothetical protein
MGAWLLMGPPVSDRSWARCRTVTHTLALQVGGKNSVVSKPEQRGIIIIIIIMFVQAFFFS